MRAFDFAAATTVSQALAFAGTAPPTSPAARHWST